MYYATKLPQFDNMNKNYQPIARYNEYEDIIVNSFLTLFDCNLGDNAIYPHFVNMICTGEIGVHKNGKIGRLVRRGEIDENGEMPVYSIICINGKEYKGNEESIKPLYMLPSKSPFTTFTRFARQLAEIDLSQKVFVKGTRYSTIVGCDNEEEKKALDYVFKNIEKGELMTVVRESIGWAKQTDNDKKMLNITDPNKFQSMEYLSSYHAELCRRLYGLFGFANQGKNKQAQVTTDELEGQSTPSIIYPYIMLCTMQRCIEDINSAFGFDWHIRPSVILQKVLNDILIDENANGIIDSIEIDGYTPVEENTEEEENKESKGEENGNSDV